ncbi:MAG: hypothetical protein K2X53_05375, partial [Alphaproteobacteria bacterium]|nr:hypothetical protein [Alphaproteobacteria bacterium]
MRRCVVRINAPTLTKRNRISLLITLACCLILPSLLKADPLPHKTVVVRGVSLLRAPLNNPSKTHLSAATMEKRQTYQAHEAFRD